MSEPTETSPTVESGKGELPPSSVVVTVDAGARGELASDLKGKASATISTHQNEEEIADETAAVASTPRVANTDKSHLSRPGKAPSSAFHPTRPVQPYQTTQQRLPTYPQQISPGGGSQRYYHHPPQPPPQYYTRGGYPPPYGGHPSYGGGPPPGWQAPPPYFQYHSHREGIHHLHNADEPFSRAVSSSFDRSIKQENRPIEATNYASAPDDASWGQLNQVTSVDEEDFKRPGSSLSNASGDNKKQHNRRGSLTSLASAAEHQNRPSSSNSNSSLDLLKCASGSTSNMLLPSHQRTSSLSFEKREREETPDEQKHRQAPNKRKKFTNSPALDRTEALNDGPAKPRAVYPKGSPSLNLSESFYASGMESAPTLPKVGATGTTPIPPRPGSAASNSTVGAPTMNQLPSFDLAQQGSFGGESTGGGFMRSFSFNDSYAVLGPTNSQDHHQGMQMGHPLESRNQSFEAHYPPPQYDYYDGYQGHHPHHHRVGSGGAGPYPAHSAPSWGSHGSYYAPPPPHYRMPYPPGVMRNDSNESGRASPPGSFQPPPEFRAPPSAMEHKRRGVVMATTYIPSIKTGPFGWSKDEDNRLNMIMKKHKNPRNWEPIAAELNTGRSAKEVHERWIRYLKPGVRKGQWTDAEDAIVMEAVTTSNEQPFTRWSDLANRLPGRVGKQIRDRWVNHLNPNINHLPFTKEDDLLLWEGHKDLGKRWVEISTKYFNSSRSENHIKNRWYSASFKKFISNHFGPDAYNGSHGKKKDSPKKAGTKRSMKDDDHELTSVSV